jgi:hypothetical protein
MKRSAALQTRRSGKLARVGVARAIRANTESGGVNFHHPGNPSTTRATRRPSLQAIFQAIFHVWRPRMVNRPICGMRRFRKTIRREKGSGAPFGVGK